MFSNCCSIFDTPQSSPDNETLSSPTSRKRLNSSSNSRSSKKHKTNGALNGYGQGYPHSNDHINHNKENSENTAPNTVPSNLNIDFNLLTSVLASTKNNNSTEPQKSSSKDHNHKSTHKLPTSTSSASRQKHHPTTSNTKSPGKYQTSKDSKVWIEHIKKPLDNFHKKKQIDAKAYKILCKSLTEACCRGNFMWVWPQVQDFYKKNNVEKIKLLEKHKNFKIGPLVGEWIWKHISKFLKENNVKILGEGAELSKLKNELVNKIMKYTKKKKQEANNRVGNAKSMLAELTDSNIPIDQ